MIKIVAIVALNELCWTDLSTLTQPFTYGDCNPLRHFALDLKELLVRDTGKAWIAVNRQV
jgi:hypothetical protein